MSNNKQGVKLYTEEELRKHLYNHSDEFFEQLTPIELPSDEEIKKMCNDVIIYNDSKRGWFIEGLKFMRDKIQGGNK